MTPLLGLLMVLGYFIALVFAVVFILSGFWQRASGKRAAGDILIGGGLVLLLVLMVIR